MAYFPWSNGTVEHVCHEVLRSCKALLSEWRLSPLDWPAVTECMQSVLNETPLKSPGTRNKTQPGVYRTPLEVFTGHMPRRPLLRALPARTFPDPVLKEAIQARQILNVEKRQATMSDMHRKVSERRLDARLEQIQKHNEKIKVKKATFVVGGFVLVRYTKPRRHKL